MRRTTSNRPLQAPPLAVSAAMAAVPPAAVAAATYPVAVVTLTVVATVVVVTRGRLEDEQRQSTRG